MVSRVFDLKQYSANEQNAFIRVIFVALVLVFFLSACGESKLSPLAPTATIVAFGDSLTEGVGTKPEKSYPSVLASLSGLNVINSGVSGETTSEGLERLPKVLKRYRPALVILIEGGNDILRNQNPQKTKQNLASMIELIKASDAEIVFVGVPEKNLFSNSAPFYSELAEEHDLVYDDGKILSSLLRKPSMKSDYVHLNAKGYAEMAKRIHEIMVDQGAL